MTFEEKVEFLRTLPAFKVAPIAEVRAVAFVANEEGEILLGNSGTKSLYLDRDDIEKILHEYPHLETVLKLV